MTLICGRKQLRLRRNQLQWVYNVYYMENYYNVTCNRLPVHCILPCISPCLQRITLYYLDSYTDAITDSVNYPCLISFPVPSSCIYIDPLELPLQSSRSFNSSRYKAYITSIRICSITGRISRMQKPGANFACACELFGRLFPHLLVYSIPAQYAP